LPQYDGIRRADGCTRMAKSGLWPRETAASLPQSMAKGLQDTLIL